MRILKALAIAGFAAAPVTGATEPCEVTFEFSNSVTRVHEDPRVTFPYSDAQWERIDTLGQLVDERLAEEEPFWVPGTRNGYHGFTFGWTVGEMVRRASGKSLGAFFREEVAGPLGLDFWIGLPEEQEHRVAPMIQAFVHRNEKQQLATMENCIFTDMLEKKAKLNIGLLCCDGGQQAQFSIKGGEYQNFWLRTGQVRGRAGARRHQCRQPNGGGETGNAGADDVGGFLHQMIE